MSSPNVTSSLKASSYPPTVAHLMGSHNQTATAQYNTSSMGGYDLTKDIGYDITASIDLWKDRKNKASEYKEVDYKTSNIVIGAFESALVIGVVSFIVLTDLPLLYRQIKQALKDLGNGLKFLSRSQFLGCVK